MHRRQARASSNARARMQEFDDEKAKKVITELKKPEVMAAHKKMV